MSDAGSTLPPPSAASVPPEPPPGGDSTNKVWWRRWWVIALGVFVLLIVIAAIAGGGSDEDGDPASEGTGAPGVTNAPQATDAPDETPAPEATDAPEPTEAPTTTAPPAPSDAVEGAPPSVQGDRDSPVPAGVVADVGDGWRLQILSVIDEGTQAVLEENQFNDPPPPGSRFTLVTVSLGYYGFDDPTSAFMTTIAGVASANTQLESDCGVIPNALDSFGEVFAGGVLTGNVCFVTTPADTGLLQLYATSGFSGSDVFLDAAATPAAVEPMPVLQGPQTGAASTPARLAPIPVGSPTDVGEGWALTVTSPAQDITDAVLAENQFNEAPPDGYRFVGVGLNFEYSGEGTGTAFEVTVNAAGNTNVAFAQDCGVTPGEVDTFADVFAGGSAAGVLCFVVPAEDVGTVVLYASALFDDEYSFFATQ